jgi:hypothetical protein
MNSADDFGYPICRDLQAGATGTQEVDQIASKNAEFYSHKESEILVYWAITDLCPDQMSKRQDQWRDGN